MATPPAPRATGLGLNISSRLVGLTKVVVTITDHLERLDRADIRLEERVEKLTEKVAAFANIVSDLSGQMKGIEARLVEKDKLVAATIELEVLKATAKLRADLKKKA